MNVSPMQESFFAEPPVAVEAANSRIPIVFAADGEVFADSRDVAAAFERRHDHVLDAIGRLIRQDSDLGLREFTESSYKADPKNRVCNDNNDLRSYRCVHMNRDGFTLLAMGFTGERALRFKRLYIAAFNAMEDDLRSRKPVDMRDPRQLAAAALQLVEINGELSKRVEEQAQKIEADKPAVEFFDTYASADGLHGLQNAARILGQGPNRFIRWLKADYLFMQGGSLVPHARWTERGLFVVKVAHAAGEKVRQQTYMTPKGVTYFARVLGVEDVSARMAEPLKQLANTGLFEVVRGLPKEGA